MTAGAHDSKGQGQSASSPEIFVNGKLVGRGWDGMAVALAVMVERENDSQPPCPRCKSTSVNCPLSGPGCPYDDASPSSPEALKGEQG